MWGELVDKWIYGLVQAWSELKAELFTLHYIIKDYLLNFNCPLEGSPCEVAFIRASNIVIMAN